MVDFVKKRGYQILLLYFGMQQVHFQSLYGKNLIIF
jgi:hypothetical protein